MRIQALALITNNANNKILTVKLGGSVVLSVSGTASAALGLTAQAQNCNSQSSQIFGNGAVSGSTGLINAGAVDTSVDQILTITGQLGVAADVLTLRSYTIEVLPSV